MILRPPRDDEFDAMLELMNAHQVAAFGEADVTADELRLWLTSPSVDIRRDLRVLGPAPAPLARIKNRHRWQVLVKARSRPDARDALDLALGRLEEAEIPLRAITIEVDPVSLM